MRGVDNKYFRYFLYFQALILSYFICYKLGLEILVKPIRILVVLIFLIEFLVVLDKKKIRFGSTVEGLFFCYVVIYCVISLLNGFGSMGLSLKFVVYILAFYIGKHSYKSINSILMIKIKRWIKWSFYLVVAVSSYQLYMGDLELINSVYRLSGPYYRHSSGFAIFLILLIGYYAFSPKVKFRSLIVLLLMCFLLKTGSRSAFAGVLIASVFISLKNLDFRYLFFFSLIFVALMINLDYLFDSPVMARWKFLYENGLDGSVLSRISYFEKISSIKEFSVFGGGVGSFVNSYEAAFGKRLGAHNNILLIIVEFGYLGLAIYATHLIVFFRKVLLIEDKMLLFLFLNIYIGAMFNNNYYYPLPMIMLLILFGYRLSEHHENNKEFS